VAASASMGGAPPHPTLSPSGGEGNGMALTGSLAGGEGIGMALTGSLALGEGEGWGEGG